MATTKSYLVYQNDQLTYEISKEGFKTIVETTPPIQSNTSYSKNMEPTFSYTLIPTPSDAYVELVAPGFDTVAGYGTQVINVSYGTEVTYWVRASGYTTVCDSVVLYDSATDRIELQEMTFPYTVIPTPSDAYVVLSAPGFNTVSGTGTQVIYVTFGTEVTYEVSKSGYITETNTVLVYDGATDRIELQPESGGSEVDVTDYEYEMDGSDLILTLYTGNDTIITSPNI